LNKIIELLLYYSRVKHNVSGIFAVLAIFIPFVLAKGKS